MNPTVKNAIDRSHLGDIPFGELVGILSAAGFESYRVDYRMRKTDYFLPSGETFTVDLPAPAIAVAEAFDGSVVQDAVRGAQRGDVRYPEFLARTMRAGCIGYTVWIAGRHVTYVGRRGESHVERFPD